MRDRWWIFGLAGLGLAGLGLTALVLVVVAGLRRIEAPERVQPRPSSEPAVVATSPPPPVWTPETRSAEPTGAAPVAEDLADPRFDEAPPGTTARPAMTTMPASVAISGLVLDPEGRALDGASVSFEMQSQDRRSRIRPPASVCREGRFSVRVCAPDRVMHGLVRASHPDFLKSVEAKLNVAPGLNGDAGVLQFAHHGGWIGGVVVTPEGEPVPKLALQLFPRFPSEWTSCAIDVETDEHGVFRSGVLDIGAYDLCGPPGLESPGPIVIRDHGYEVTLPALVYRSPEFFEIHGTVTMRDGAPAKGARVWIVPTSERAALGRASLPVTPKDRKIDETSTDEHGCFRLETGSAAGPFDLFVGDKRGERMGSARVEGIWLLGQTVELVLDGRIHAYDPSVHGWGR